MDKKAIVIIGNIASGKSSVIAELKLLLPDFSVISTDDIRRSSGDKILCENEITAIAIHQIECSQNCIIELTGVGQNYSKILYRLKQLNFKIKRYLIDCPPELCYRRYDERKRSAYKAFSMFKGGHLKEGIYANHEFLQNINHDEKYNSYNSNAKRIALTISLDYI